MRLLRITGDGDLQFTNDIIRKKDVPPYAILSHTWGEQEVLYNDLTSSDSVTDISENKREGWGKLQFCARQAKRDGLEHFWVDTCCIDKANHTELSEAINSMFRWYQKADKCYVYLPDVEGKPSTEDGRPSSQWKAAFRASRWFTRGWTLQELLAPRSVEFFSKDGARLGDKDSLKQTIHEITRIPAEALSESDMSKFEFTERFSWAQDRQTTREEDGAYCLLGILDCYLPLIYGEGRESAFKRLRKETQGGERQSKIRSWLSAPDPSTNYHKAHKQRQAGTGLWLLHSERFKRWKEASASRLWLYGIPGCGKTILSSTVVENLQHHCRDDKREVTVYFYFDFNDMQKQDPELMFRSLFRQLLQRSVKIPEEVNALFSSCGDGQQQPSLPALLNVAPQLVRQFTHVYIVLDALDESAKRAELMDMLETVAGWQLGILHLLMTSRKERDIEMSLETFISEHDMICLQRDVVDRDILRFVQQKIGDDKRLAKWNKNVEVREEIETALMRGAQGMFRWAVCQLDMIAECRNLAMLRKSLATLPQTLDQTYDRILTGISEKDRTYAIRILQWLTFSARPLHLEEVAEVIAIDVGREPVFDRDEVLLEPLEALEICSSLVTITADEYNDFNRPNYFPQIVTLAHYSVQEYLVSARIKRAPAKEFSMQEIDCHEIITKGCIGYLNQFQQPLTAELYEASALTDYSAEFWTAHFQKTRDGDEDMSLLAVDLMSAKSSTFANWISVFDPDDPLYMYPVFWQKDPEDLATPLYYAALLGLTTIAKLLLQQDVDINARGGRRGNALHAALDEGHLAVVKLLVKAKANVNDRGGQYQSVLHLALDLADVAVVKLLIDAGADVNMRDEEGCSVLQTASELGNEAVAKLLIEVGADVNAPGNEYVINALQAASGGGHTAIVKLLIDAGAEVNAQDGAPGHALRSALRCAHETTAILLVKEGANVGLDEMLKGALHHIVNSEWCPPKLVNVLLQYGAPTNTIDMDNMTPLHYCVKFEHEAVAKQLIDAGVPIDSRVCREARPCSDRVGKSGNDQVNTTSVVLASATIGLTPLHFAALEGKVRMIRFLLDHGADPNAVSEYGETPLHLALSSKVLGIGCRDDWNKVILGTTRARNDVLDALLADPRINPRMTDVTSKGPLHCMHYGTPGSAILVRKFISRGADLSSVNSNQESPLHLAIQAGDHESVKVLLSMGANVSWADESGLNILHYAAAENKNHEILVAILESEQANAVALVTSKDGHGHNVLHHLLSLTSTTQAPQFRTVQWLLGVGASGSDLDHSGCSPLARYFHSCMGTLDVEICKSLLHVKGSASFVGFEGQKLGHLCARRFDLGVPILKVLNRHGVDLATKDWDGRTILHYAVMHDSLTAQVLRYLVDVVGIPEDEQDKQGRTALQYAIEKVDGYRDRGFCVPWYLERVKYIKLILSE